VENDVMLRVKNTMLISEHNKKNNKQGHNSKVNQHHNQPHNKEAQVFAWDLDTLSVPSANV
jgi:hypothetical protein